MTTTKPKRINLTTWISGDLIILKNGHQREYNLFGYPQSEKDELVVYLNTHNLGYEFTKTGIAINPIK